MRLARGTAIAPSVRVVAVKKLRHEPGLLAVTAVELAWKLQPPPLPTRNMPPPPRRVPMATPARPTPPQVGFAVGTVTHAAKPGVLATGIPSMTDLTALAKAIANEQRFENAALRLQVEACKITRAAEALCVVFDWPRRTAWTIQGPIANESVKELVAHVAGSGRRSIIGNALLEPIGPAPSRAVLALRKPTGATFSAQEIAMISTLALGLASSIDRLINVARR